MQDSSAPASLDLPDAILMEHVSKSFGHKTVLHDVTLRVPTGKSLAIIGGSGCGKSICIKMMMGLIRPDRGGRIWLQGLDMTKLSRDTQHKAMQSIGVLFQGGALFDSLPVWENVAFALIHRDQQPRSAARNIAIQKLAAVGLGEDIGALYPSELSGGMQKRVALARCIATDPRVIFFDEPTTGLDPIMSAVINQLIVQCSKESGATTITITHDMQSVRTIADEVAMIHQGHIIWHGTKQEMDSTSNAYVQQFIHGQAEGPITVESNQ